MPIRDYLTLDDDINILEVLGDEGVVFTDAAIPAIVSYDSQDLINQEASFISPVVMLTCLKKDLPPKAKRGTKFTHGTKKLMLDQLEQDTETHTVWKCRYAKVC